MLGPLIWVALLVVDFKSTWKPFALAVVGIMVAWGGDSMTEHEGVKTFTTPSIEAVALTYDEHLPEYCHRTRVARAGWNRTGVESRKFKSCLWLR